MDQQMPNVAPQPAGTPPGMQIASRENRLFASLVDSAILGAAFTFAVVFLLSISIGITAASVNPRELEDAMMIVIVIVSVFIYLVYLIGIFLYFSLFHAGKKQATVGKRVLSIMVVDRTGQPITRGTSFLRSLCFFIPFAPLFILFNDEHQGLHDMIAGTFVVNGKIE